VLNALANWGAVVVPLLALPAPISSIFRSRRFCASRIYSFVLSDGRTLVTQAGTVRTPLERCMNWKLVNNILFPLLPLRMNCLHFACLHSRRTIDLQSRRPIAKFQVCSPLLSKLNEDITKVTCLTAKLKFISSL